MGGRSASREQAAWSRGRSNRRWVAKPGLAWLLRALSWTLPVVVSVAVTSAAGRWLPAPEGSLEVVAWWVALSLIATGVLYGVDSVTRRLLPLAALFKLSLVFPDRAPARFRTACGPARSASSRRTSAM